MAGLHKPVELVAEAPSGLTRERWVFTLDGNRLILDRYYYERRRSKTRQFKLTKFYDSHRLPGEDYGDWTWLGENEVPWDEDLKGEALAKLTEYIMVVRKADLV